MKYRKNTKPPAVSPKESATHCLEAINEYFYVGMTLSGMLSALDAVKDAPPERVVSVLMPKLREIDAQWLTTFRIDAEGGEG